MASPPIFGAQDLRALCRQMGVLVSFGAVSMYSDGTPIMGLFDRPVQIKGFDEAIGGYSVALPELRIPFNAFAPPLQAGDAITVGGVDYTVNTPTAEDDGGMLCYELRAA